MLNTCQDSTRFRSSIENGAAHDEWQRAFFRLFFLTPRRNEANDTSLVRYNRGASFLYVLFPLIRYDLRAVSTTRNMSTCDLDYWSLNGHYFPFVTFL